VVTVAPSLSLIDAADEQFARIRDRIQEMLRELSKRAGLGAVETEVVPARFAARELQRITEAATTGLIVVGSTTRGPLGRLLLGGVGSGCWRVRPVLWRSRRTGTVTDARRAWRGWASA